MEKRRQSNAKYKGLGVQRETSKEVSGLICRSIYDRGSDIITNKIVTGCDTGAE